jgi:hypothetical protein
MSSDSIHDAVFVVQRKRGRTPARSIDAALLARLYSRNCDYLMIKRSLFSMVLPPISPARPGQKRTKKEAKLDGVFHAIRK